jgi:hypothetical protein
MRFVPWTLIWLLALGYSLPGCGASGKGGSTVASNARKEAGRRNSRRQKQKKVSSTRSGKGLKGKGSSAAHESRRATEKRMAGWNVTAEKVMAVAPLVEKAAEENHLPASLIYGVIWVESRFNPEAVSKVGARGLMQLMPRTASYLAECIGWEGRFDSFDPEFNIAAGSYYVARLIKQFDGDVDLALAAYNAGPTNIRRWMRNTGLPEVSIEYYTMVQTAQTYFPSGSPLQNGTGMDAVLPTDDDLDRLGLAILIAGLSRQEFGMLRPDDANPFDDM